MELHLTVNEKLVGSIAINPERRSEKDYIEQMKKLLNEKYSALIQIGYISSFYVAPAIDVFENNGLAVYF